MLKLTSAMRRACLNLDNVRKLIERWQMPSSYYINYFNVKLNA